MKSLTVIVDSIKEPIQPSPGFGKKELSDYKLDILGLCGFGCGYCSSNAGNYLRIRREAFLDATLAQLGKKVLPADEPALTFVWPDILPKLEAQVTRKGRAWGEGQTLMFSMLTDGFSPDMVTSGTTEAALKIVLAGTSFRIRVLTKNAIVGSPKWVGFFADHADRFVVGLSNGTSDASWSRTVELGTSSPSARLRALRHLQDAGVPTFGMVCPVFPDMLEGDRLERLVEQMRPELLEHVWAEPFNDRQNWKVVRAGYEPTTPGYKWMTHVYEQRDTTKWSRYATDLYTRLRKMAERDGWLSKLRYLLYELDIAGVDAGAFADLAGVLLQSKPAADGTSKNKFFSAASDIAHSVGK